jgi:hypothetical protein
MTLQNTRPPAQANDRLLAFYRPHVSVREARHTMMSGQGLGRFAPPGMTWKKKNRNGRA